MLLYLHKLLCLWCPTGQARWSNGPYLMMLKCMRVKSTGSHSTYFIHSIFLLLLNTLSIVLVDFLNSYFGDLRNFLYLIIMIFRKVRSETLTFRQFLLNDNTLSYFRLWINKEQDRQIIYNTYMFALDCEVLFAQLEEVFIPPSRRADEIFKNWAYLQAQETLFSHNSFFDLKADWASRNFSDCTHFRCI